MNKINEADKKDKVIFNNSSVLDINFIENPMFISSIKEAITIGDLGTKCEKLQVSEEIKNILRKLLESQSRESLVVYRKWTDSKGNSKELLIANSLPTLGCFDIWNGLIGLFLNKLTPIAYDNLEKCFNIDIYEMEFTLYELSKFMGKSLGGYTTEKLKEELYTLCNSTYYSVERNMIFDKKNNEYLHIDEKGFSLIWDLTLNSRKDKSESSKDSKCKVVFNKVIIENIKYEYFKYLKPNVYFALPSKGIVRRLYTYILGSLYNTNKTENTIYLKRNYFVIGNKLPLYPLQRSKIKEKLNIALKHLINNGIITDYFYGDEIVLNNVKEDVLYIVFKGTKEDVITTLDKNALKNMLNNKEENNLLEIPKDIRKELFHIGVTENKVNEIMQKYDKWKLIQYILWIKEKAKESDKKPTNLAGLLIYALQTDTFKLELTHEYIVDFVKNEKAKLNKNTLTEEQIREKYEKYIDKEISKFMKEEDFIYEMFKENILTVIASTLDQKITQFKMIYNTCNNENDKKSIQKQLDELIEFKNNKEESQLFKQHIKKEIMVYRGLKDFNHFKLEISKTK
ncbi:replication initiator protein A [Clostridium tarantellae]|uniref:Uncharacterized protein n=1 Tax=Clostridium tarantellae TaxID=39493 RepID=A0A6I1MKC0_9CLOT|nr:replication initiator protein A [Clostridium tarantellae]MPQ43163.1 hypothetical protein [Clostridium tarantellae]